MAQIKQLGHVVLFVNDPMASADWYCNVLGMEAVVRDDRIPAAFLSFGRRDHDIALFRSPDDRRLGHHDVEHVSCEIDGDIDDLKKFHAMLIEKGIDILGVVDHGISYGVYFRDPDGHHLEVFYQRIPDGFEAKTTFGQIGALAKEIDMTKLD